MEYKSDFLEAEKEIDLQIKEMVLEDKHVINFQDETRDISIPEWFQIASKKLWSGDVDYECLDFEDLFYMWNRFRSPYNVFFCYPDYSSNLKSYVYLYKNINFLKRRLGRNNFLICIINTANIRQVEKFTRIFRNYFDEYQISGSTCRNFDLLTISEILKLNGKYYDNTIPYTGIQPAIGPGRHDYSTVDTYIKLLESDLITEKFGSKTVYHFWNYNFVKKLYSRGILPVSDNPSIQLEKFLDDTFDSLIAKLLEKIYNILDNYTFTKFYINGPIKNNLNIITVFLNTYYNNKWCIFQELLRIYLFLIQNFYIILPDNLFGLIDIDNENFKIVFYYQKIDDLKFESFYKKKYLKYKQKYLLSHK